MPGALNQCKLLFISIAPNTMCPKMKLFPSPVHETPNSCSHFFYLCKYHHLPSFKQGTIESTTNSHYLHLSHQAPLVLPKICRI